MFIKIISEGELSELNRKQYVLYFLLLLPIGGLVIAITKAIFRGLCPQKFLAYEGFAVSLICIFPIIFIVGPILRYYISKNIFIKK